MMGSPDVLERLATQIQRLTDGDELVAEDAGTLLARLAACQRHRKEGNLFAARQCLGEVVLELERMVRLGNLASETGRGTFTTARQALLELRAS